MALLSLDIISFPQIMALLFIEMLWNNRSKLCTYAIFSWSRISCAHVCGRSYWEESRQTADYFSVSCWWHWTLSKALDACLIYIKPKPFTQIKLPYFNCSCICNHLAKCLQFVPTPICWMNPKSWFIRGILKRLSALKCRCKFFHTERPTSLFLKMRVMLLNPP